MQAIWCTHKRHSGRNTKQTNLTQTMADCNSLQATWQCHIVKTLVETITEYDTLQATWQCHIVETLVEVMAKYDALQATRKCDIVETSVKLLMQVLDAIPDMSQIILEHLSTLQTKHPTFAP